MLFSDIPKSLEILMEIINIPVHVVTPLPTPNDAIYSH